MGTPQFTPEGKWILYHRVTGQALARWPVDARGILATGDYTADPSEVGSDAPAATVDAPSEPVPAQHALGIPLVLTRAHETAPSQPLQDAVRTSRASKRR